MAHRGNPSRRKGHTPPRGLAGWLFKNQISLSFNSIGFLLFCHLCVPGASQYTSKFLKLSYYNVETEKYASGYDDFYLMALCIVVLTGLRASMMRYVLAPLASRWGVSSKKDATRFAEQGWMVMYYNLCWPLGMYLYSNSKYFLRMEELWTDFPEREISGLMKFYIIGQWAFWFQQILVINIEERRKDHWPMLLHHFVTIALLAGSYAYHQTRVANLMLILMDVIDLFLPLAKCLKYAGFTTICDVIFVGFLISWILARHVLYIMTCFSLYFDYFRMTQEGCYRGPANKIEGPLPIPTHGWSHFWEPFRNSSGIICVNYNVMYAFLSFLVLLQVLMITWFAVIVRIVLRMLQGKRAEDLRSNSEAEETEKEQEACDSSAQPQFIEKECNSENMEWKSRDRRPGTINTNSNGGGGGGGGGSSSISYPGVRDRKELLNRIGCEKQIE